MSLSWTCAVVIRASRRYTCCLLWFASKLQSQMFVPYLSSNGMPRLSCVFTKTVNLQQIQEHLFISSQGLYRVEIIQLLFLEMHTTVYHSKYEAIRNKQCKMIRLCLVVLIQALRCIHHLPFFCKFSSWNQVISWGICNPKWEQKISPHRFCIEFKMQFCHIDQQNTAWFGSDFCVNCASYIATLLTFNVFCLQHFTNVTTS